MLSMKVKVDRAIYIGKLDKFLEDRVVTVGFVYLD